jgi:hypothetical protein
VLVVNLRKWDASEWSQSVVISKQVAAETVVMSKRLVAVNLVFSKEIVAKNFFGCEMRTSKLRSCQL